MPIPRFLQNYNANGRVREDHAPKTVLRFSCNSELCQGEEREFQIASVDVGSEISVFRCVVCNNRTPVRNYVNGPKAEPSQK